MLPAARSVALTEVPVVDLAPAWSGDAFARRQVMGEIAAACHEIGFFYVRNHRIARDDIARIFQTAADFHNLPLEAKMEVSITRNDHFQGYLHGMSKGNDKTITENLQEAFQIRRPLAADDPDLLAGKNYHGVIPWPSAMPDLKPRMMAYFGKLDVLGYALLDMFEESLDLPPGHLKQYFAKDMNSLRLLHYPPQAPDAPAAFLGARAHSDTNAFTILAQDDNGGLEVRTRAGEWLAVPPIADTLVVNVGEVLKVWTDGIFSSAAHRVINRSGRERYSIPYFMYPSYDALIMPIVRNPDPSSVAPEDLQTSMPRDRPFVYGEFKSRNSARINPGRAG
ncbi:MAG TPA: 2-oxoglutarate and iron-dependent oxygenase domain-containing protein [Stellaceae bacterium]|nr:2-oxoglutarate and iron-dependent oxygenase domain-containing protein [Stellaceae bacterium]